MPELGLSVASHNLVCHKIVPPFCILLFAAKELQSGVSTDGVHLSGEATLIHVRPLPVGEHRGVVLGDEDLAVTLFQELELAPVGFLDLLDGLFHEQWIIL